MDNKQELKELCDDWHDQFDVISVALDKLIRLRKRIVEEKLLDDESIEAFKAFKLKACNVELFSIWQDAGGLLIKAIPNEILFSEKIDLRQSKEMILEVARQANISPQRLAGTRVKMSDGQLLPFWEAWRQIYQK